MLDRLRKAFAPPPIQTGAPQNNPLIAVRFIKTPNGKKIHRCINVYGGEAVAYCGKELTNVQILVDYPDGGGYWETKLGEGYAWAQAQVPEGSDLCKGCFGVTE